MTQPTHCYILQRATGALLIPISIWILFFIIPILSMLLYPPYDVISMTKILFSDFFKIVCLILFIVCSTYHGCLGLKAITSDYVHNNSIKKVADFIIFAMTIFIIITVTSYIIISYIEVNMNSLQLEQLNIRT